MIKVFECYAGYGGCSFALRKAKIKHKVVGYSEIKPSAIKLYEKNHKGIKNYGDITKIDPNDLPDFDLISGGFPCQDVSIAGRRDLSVGRTDTIWDMLNIIKVKKPKYILLENVKGILSMQKGEYLQNILREIKGLGYTISYKLVNSLDYGIPQNRERIYFCCELNRDAFGFNPFPKKEELNLFLKDVLQEKVADKYYLNESKYKSLMRGLERRSKPFKTQDTRALCLMAKNPTRYLHDATIIESCAMRTRDKDGEKGKRIEVNSDKFANSITTHKYDSMLIVHNKQPRNGKGVGGKGHLMKDGNTSYCIDPKNSQYIEYKDKLRVLTPRECFRLMGFINDEINIDGFKDTPLYEAAGNGWDINLVSKILSKWLNN